MSCPSDDIHIKDTISEQKDWKTIYCETKEINDFAIAILNQTDKNQKFNVSKNSVKFPNSSFVVRVKKIAPF